MATTHRTLGFTPAPPRPVKFPLTLTFTFTLALACAPLIAQPAAGPALTTHAPALSGNARIDGSIQQLTGEGASFSGNAAISGDLRVPGIPTLQLSGRARSGGTTAGTGAPTPTGYIVALSGNAAIGHLVPRTDPVALPRVDRPPPPTGTRTLSTSERNPDVGDFRTLRDLTVNGNGTIRLPPGFYGTVIANGNATLILGRAGDAAPAIYGFERISINGNGRLQIDGPVVATLAAGFYSARTAGSSDHLAWLELRVATGDVAFSGEAAFFGSLIAPFSAVSASGNAALTGALAADRLRLEGNAALRVTLDLPRRPPFTASVPFATGFEPTEGFVPGPLAGQRGWTVPSGTANIVTSPVFEGNQAVAIPAGQSATALLELTPSLPAVTFVDTLVRPHVDLARQTGTELTFSGGAIRLAAPNGVARWEVMDGPAWRPLEPPVPLDATGSAPAWHRLTARLAYPQHTWDLYVDSRLTATDLSLSAYVSGYPLPAVGSPPANLTRVAIAGPGPAGLDLAYAAYDNPIFADADADGLDDAWETANGLDPTRDDRNADRDGDGLTNLREYLLGTRANQSDTDGDGVPDALELAQSRNPLKGATPDAGTLHLQLFRP